MRAPDSADPAPDAGAAELAGALRAAAPRGVDVGVRRITTGDAERLHPAERELTVKMAPTRLAEFATGRHLVRELTGTRDAVLRAVTGAPIMPRRWIGSLAHDRVHAIAAVTTRADVAAIGVDLEPVHTAALTGEEAAIIVRDDDVVDDVLAAFVMKEAVYKAWSVLGGALLDHHDVRVEQEGDSFRAHVVAGAGSPPAPSRTAFAGRLSSTSGHRLALVVVGC